MLYLFSHLLSYFCCCCCYIPSGASRFTRAGKVASCFLRFFL